MNCSFMPCYRTQYCNFPVRSRTTYRNNACGKTAYYVLMVDSHRSVAYYCLDHIDARIREIRYEMDSELKKRGKIKS